MLSLVPVPGGRHKVKAAVDARVRNCDRAMDGHLYTTVDGHVRDEMGGGSTRREKREGEDEA